VHRRHPPHPWPPRWAARSLLVAIPSKHAAACAWPPAAAPRVRAEGVVLGVVRAMLASHIALGVVLLASPLLSTRVVHWCP
jgi:hypothetical protein